MCVFRPECFILVDLQGGGVGGSDLGSGDGKKKKSSENFQSFFFAFFLNISRKKPSKTNKVNQQSLNISSLS